MIRCIQVAGLMQLVIAVANFFVPSKIGYKENLSRLSPIVRQVLIVHHVYIVLVVAAFGLMNLLYAPDLARPEPLSRFMAGFLAVFWSLRVPIQLFYYDPELRKSNFKMHLLFSAMFLYLGGTFAALAAGLGR
jgi:hypothetical protein